MPPGATCHCLGRRCWGWQLPLESCSCTHCQLVRWEIRGLETRSQHETGHITVVWSFVLEEGSVELEGFQSKAIFGQPVPWHLQSHVMLWLWVQWHLSVWRQSAEANVWTHYSGFLWLSEQCGWQWILRCKCVSTALHVIVASLNLCLLIGRTPKPAGYEQFGSGSRTAGSVLRLVHWKKGQVTHPLWKKALFFPSNNLLQILYTVLRGCHIYCDLFLCHVACFLWLHFSKWSMYFNLFSTILSMLQCSHPLSRQELDTVLAWLSIHIWLYSFSEMWEHRSCSMFVRVSEQQRCAACVQWLCRLH